MTTIEVLGGLRELLTYETWVKGALAYDAAGTPRFPTSPEACNWCLAGGLEYVVAGREGGDGVALYEEAMRLLCRQVVGNPDLEPSSPEGCFEVVTVYNDGAWRTLADIHKLLDDAIAEFRDEISSDGE